MTHIASETFFYYDVNTFEICRLYLSKAGPVWAEMNNAISFWKVFNCGKELQGSSRVTSCVPFSPKRNSNRWDDLPTFFLLSLSTCQVRITWWPNFVLFFLIERSMLANCWTVMPTEIFVSHIFVGRGEKRGKGEESRSLITRYKAAKV